MKCKHCNNTILDTAKFCNECGKPIDMIEKTEKKDVNIEKIKKSLKNTGNSVYAIGWLTIIINAGIYLWSILDKNFAEYELPASDLSGTFLMIVASSIFIILGNRIRGFVDKKIKLYLQILLGLSLLLLIWVLGSGGKVGLLFFLIIVYLTSSLISIHKAMKAKAFISTLTSPTYKLNRKGWIIFAIVTIILFFITLGIDLSGQNYENYSNLNYSTQDIDESYSTQDLIQETVKEIKAEMALPSQLDETTKLVDITAQPSAIHYHYILSNIDTSTITNSYLKDYLGVNICKNTDTKSLLDQGINMEYSYIVEGATQKYFVLFSKADCL